MLPAGPVPEPSRSSDTGSANSHGSLSAPATSSRELRRLAASSCLWWRQRSDDSDCEMHAATSRA